MINKKRILVICIEKVSSVSVGVLFPLEELEKRLAERNTAEAVEKAIEMDKIKETENYFNSISKRINENK